MTTESEANKPVETWEGSCHCGKVKFSLNMHKPLYEQDITSCNCSICQRNGYLFIYPQNSDITWQSGKDSLKVYTFGSNKIEHRFCTECGTSICGASKTPGFFEGITALNVRTFEDVDIKKLKLKLADGRALKMDDPATYGKVQL